MKRETLRKILTRLSTILARVEFSGTENLPPEGGLIIATNHMSRVDTLLAVHQFCPHGYYCAGR